MTASTVQRSMPSSVPTAPSKLNTISTGVRLFIKMASQLASIKTLPRSDRTLADQCQFERKYREGLPFQNIVADYLELAQLAGPAAVSGFCACIGDYLSTGLQNNGGRRLDDYGTGACGAAAIARYLAESTDRVRS